MPHWSRAVLRFAAPLLITIFFIVLSFVAFGQANPGTTANPAAQTPTQTQNPSGINQPGVTTPYPNLGQQPNTANPNVTPEITPNSTLPSQNPSQNPYGNTDQNGNPYPNVNPNPNNPNNPNSPFNPSSNPTVTPNANTPLNQGYGSTTMPRASGSGNTAAGSGVVGAGVPAGGGTPTGTPGRGWEDVDDPPQRNLPATAGEDLLIALAGCSSLLGAGVLRWCRSR